MVTSAQIKKQKQIIVKCENSLALEKLKKRRADTRRKIELGGLVIKAGMDGFDKSTILGALNYSFNLLSTDDSYIRLFAIKGNDLFSNR